MDQQVHISQLQGLTLPVTGAELIQVQRTSLSDPTDQDRKVALSDVFSALGGGGGGSGGGVISGVINPSGAPAASVILYMNTANKSLWFWNGSVWEALIQ